MATVVTVQIASNPVKSKAPVDSAPDKLSNLLWYQEAAEFIERYPQRRRPQTSGENQHQHKKDKCRHLFENRWMKAPLLSISSAKERDKTNGGSGREMQETTHGCDCKVIYRQPDIFTPSPLTYKRKERTISPESRSKSTSNVLSNAERHQRDLLSGHVGSVVHTFETLALKSNRQSSARKAQEDFKLASGQKFGVLQHQRLDLPIRHWILTNHYGIKKEELMSLKLDRQPIAETVAINNRKVCRYPVPTQSSTSAWPLQSMEPRRSREEEDFVSDRNLNWNQNQNRNRKRNWTERNQSTEIKQSQRKDRDKHTTNIRSAFNSEVYYRNLINDYRKNLSMTVPRKTTPGFGLEKVNTDEEKIREIVNQAFEDILADYNNKCQCCGKRSSANDEVDAIKSFPPRKRFHSFKKARAPPLPPTASRLTRTTIEEDKGVIEEIKQGGGNLELNADCQVTKLPSRKPELTLTLERTPSMSQKASWQLRRIADGCESEAHLTEPQDNFYQSFARRGIVNPFVKRFNNHSLMAGNLHKSENDFYPAKMKKPSFWRQMWFLPKRSKLSLKLRGKERVYSMAQEANVYRKLEEIHRERGQVKY